MDVILATVFCIMALSLLAQQSIQLAQHPKILNLEVPLRNRITLDDSPRPRNNLQFIYMCVPLPPSQLLVGSHRGAIIYLFNRKVLILQRKLTRTWRKISISSMNQLLITPGAI